MTFRPLVRPTETSTPPAEGRIDVGPDEVRGVHQTPAGADGTHRPVPESGTQQVVAAALEPEVPDPGGGGCALGLEEPVRVRLFDDGIDEITTGLEGHLAAVHALGPDAPEIRRSEFAERVGRSRAPAWMPATGVRGNMAQPKAPLSN